MTNFIKIIACTSVIVSFAYPVSAKVIHLNDLTNFLFMGSEDVNMKGSGDGSSCSSASGEYSVPPEGRSCAYDSDKKCYVNCMCDASKFNYTATNLDTTFFKPAGETCKDNNGNYYDELTCNTDNFVVPVSDAPNTNYFSYTEKVSGSTRCYDLKDATCKAGGQIDNVTSSTVTGSLSTGWNATVTVSDEPLVYTAKANVPSATSGLIFCATGIKEVYGGYGYIGSAPANPPKCALTTTTTAVHYPSDTYTFYNGECSNSGSCVTSGVCVRSTEGEDFNYWAAGPMSGKKCTYALSCLEEPESGCYGNTRPSDMTGFNVMSTSVTTSSGNQTCYYIDTGNTANLCDTDNGYSLYDGAAAEAEADNNYTYTVKSTTVGVTSYICRAPSGCAVGDGSKTIINANDCLGEAWANFINYFNPACGNF